jgi:phospholipid transport system transporter-binding protein
MIQVNGEGWRLEGPLTIATATDALAEGEQAWPPAGWTIDLGGLGQVDSAALSVLLTWQRRADAQSQRLSMVNLPDSLGSLADVYGVRPLIAGTAE